MLRKSPILTGHHSFCSSLGMNSTSRCHRTDRVSLSSLNSSLTRYCIIDCHQALSKGLFRILICCLPLLNIFTEPLRNLLYFQAVISWKPSIYAPFYWQVNNLLLRQSEPLASSSKIRLCSARFLVDPKRHQVMTIALRWPTFCFHFG